VGKAIPFTPVAERVAVETLSTILPVLACKPVVFTNVTLTEMRSAMVRAGKMTVSTAMAATDVTTPVATTMTAATMASPMATMAAATVTTTLAP
jgi:hypothetical protein